MDPVSLSANPRGRRDAVNEYCWHFILSGPASGKAWFSIPARSPIRLVCREHSPAQQCAWQVCRDAGVLSTPARRCYCACRMRALH